MRILVVEDELDLLHCLRTYFLERGHQVATASIASEAIQQLDAFRPDTAFIDLILPRGNGQDVIQAIVARQLPTRIVVITGQADFELRQQLLASGVSVYLFKPLALRDLNQLVSDLALVQAEDATRPTPGQAAP